MDWKKFLQSLIDAKNKFLSDANKALAPLPPVEQHDASSVVGSALRQLNSAYQWITNLCMQMDTDLKEYIQRGEQILADCNKAYVEDQVSKGELIPKAKIEAGDYLTKEVAQQNCNAAADTAKQTGREEALTEFKLLAARRTELCSPKLDAKGVETTPALLSREVVDRLPDDLIKADDYLAKATQLAARLKEVQSLGVEVPGLLKRAEELALDDTGETQFKDQMSMIRQAAGKTGGGGTEPAATAPLATGSSGAGTRKEFAGVF